MFSFSCTQHNTQKTKKTKTQWLVCQFCFYLQKGRMKADDSYLKLNYININSQTICALASNFFGFSFFSLKNSNVIFSYILTVLIGNLLPSFR